LDTPGHVEGNNLLPLLKDSNSPWEHTVLTTAGFRNHSVRNKRYRYTLWSNRAEELYDHKADPHEWQNLAAKKSMQKIKQELKTKLPENNARPRR
jgi:ABC-type Zn uptake system ZnuABC Zn-binding protein ZnuA